jgi:hypothetical protein
MWKKLFLQKQRLICKTIFDNAINAMNLNI